MTTTQLAWLCLTTGLVFGGLIVGLVVHQKMSDRAKERAEYLDAILDNCTYWEQEYLNIRRANK